MCHIQAGSQLETEMLGEKLAANIFPGAFIALYGGLGAGKTALVRGLAQALGIIGVTSPTYTYLQEYNGRIPLYHFDVYRLQSMEELLDIGFEEYLAANGVIAMEWPEHVQGALPSARMDVKMQGSGNLAREITFIAYGQAHEALLGSLE